MKKILKILLIFAGFAAVLCLISNILLAEDCDCGCGHDDCDCDDDCGDDCTCH